MTRRYLLPEADSLFITSSRLKLAGFWRIGNSWKLDSQFATIACDGTTTKARAKYQDSYSIDSSPRSNGSALRLNSLGTRSVVNSSRQTPMPVLSCALNTTFQSWKRTATSSPSSFQ